jgi:hypothetical protein
MTYINRIVIPITETQQRQLSVPFAPITSDLAIVFWQPSRIASGAFQQNHYHSTFNPEMFVLWHTQNSIAIATRLSEKCLILTTVSTGLLAAPNKIWCAM